MANPFQSVPFKVISYILSLTDPETVSRVSQTCHALCASIRDDAFLWKYLFAKYFDLPEEHHQSIDWRSQIQSRIRAKHTILAPSSAHIPSEELENALKILIQIVRSAPPGSGHSNNITWANGILTNPDLCATHSPLTSAHPRLSQNLQSQSELQVLECDKLGIPEERFTARAFVYDTRNYRHSNLYGPFMPRVSQNEPLQINYVHLRYLMNVLLNNLRDGHSDDTDMWMKRGFENTRSMTAPPSPVDGDWAGVQGDWMRFAAWVGYEELEEYNWPGGKVPDAAGELDPSVFRNPWFAEADVFYQVIQRVTSIDPPSESNPERKPTIHFEGTTVGGGTASARVRGAVSDEGGDLIRWNVRISMDGETTWCTEGVQIGGPQSAAGWVGCWTGSAREAHDPAGPVWAYKLK